MIRTLGGTPKKSSMNTIPFSPEMRALAYVMIHNLYPVTNLTDLSTPRTRFLYDLFAHKEIDICGHIFHVLKKSIEKQNSRTVMSFPPLIMGLIAKTRFKIPSGLKVVQRDCPIGDQIVNRSIAHIKGSKLVYIRYHRIELRTRGVILRRRLIDLLLLQSPQHNHPLLHQHEDQTDLIAFLIEWIRCLPCWTPMCNTQ